MPPRTSTTILQPQSVGWYCARGGEPVGPFTALEVSLLAARGRIGPDSPVWREGLPGWEKAGRYFAFPERPLDEVEVLPPSRQPPDARHLGPLAFGLGCATITLSLVATVAYPPVVWLAALTLCMGALAAGTAFALAHR